MRLMVDLAKHWGQGTVSLHAVAEREDARKAKDFARSDRIREELRQRGIALEDSKDGVRWKRIAVTEAGRS